ncbi:MAG: CDP-diacylglycerol--glycerol-3-phosphate 3-phosphatidyltransferase [Myxococcales bacterium]|nr:CDP-diacylglycerol--glycerol-3-phosphate 3-phosphatidyltransferase [Myxococcales bacterium]
MTDAAFSWITMALWVVLLAAYAIRVARFGSFRSVRVGSVGGSLLLGEDVMQATYWAIDPAVRSLVALGVTANGVTWFALFTGMAAGAAVAAGWFGLACLLATISTICDILDGQLARLTRTGSNAGELLDAAVDRYTEFAFVAGFILFAHDSPVQIVIALAALLAGFMISYSSAKAEAMHVAAPRGLMRRHERALYLILGAGLTPVFGPWLHGMWAALPPSSVFIACLAIVASIGNVSAIWRFSTIRRQLRLDPRK